MSDAALRAAADLRAVVAELAQTTVGVTLETWDRMSRTMLNAADALESRHLPPPAGPTHCFNADDWEVTYEWSDRADLYDGMFCGDVLRVGRLTRLADQWVACVPVTFDENGAPDETEMRWFNSFEEANAAANPPLAAAPPPPPSDGEKG